MIKAHKLRFYPTLNQRRQLKREFNACRFVWNWALRQRIDQYQADKKTLNAIALSRRLTKLKVLIPLLQKTSATTLTNVLWSLDDAYSRFFKKQNNFPTFKKRHVVKSACYQLDKRQTDNIFISGEKLKLPKLGTCRLVWSKEVKAFPNSATVSKDGAGRYWVSLQVDEPFEYEKVITNKTIGLDLGLTTYVATSNGEKIKPVNAYNTNLRKLKAKQRKLSKKAKGSNNRRKQRQRVSSLHAQIADQRADYCHQLSTSICRQNDAVTIEDLCVKGLIANRKLARSISDASWGEFIRQLTYKANWYHRDLTVIPRFQRTTGVCPDCGFVGEKLSLKIREWVCQCGAKHDRDIAAAIVINQLGNRARSVRIEA